jgi:hypothetical protein
MIPDAIKALRLITIYGDESTNLVSLAHRCILASDGMFTVDTSMPHLEITTELEAQIATEDGQQYDDAWPGWDAVFNFIERHPEVLTASAWPDDK